VGVAADATGKSLICSAGRLRCGQYAIVGDFDRLDLPLLNALCQIVQCDRLDVRGPTLLHHRKEEGDDRDQDDEIDEAIAEPFGIHARWDPPGCRHYTRGASSPRYFDDERGRARPWTYSAKVAESVTSSTPYGR